uniref:Uncharacterized protein n=1 Tax=Romanomermis culicivorax TaxID=13658 RepID=A0A915KQQ5_ROMCU
MDTFGPSEGDTVPKDPPTDCGPRLDDLNTDLDTDWHNQSETVFPSRILGLLRLQVASTVKFVGTTVVFKHRDRDYHCVLRQFSNVFYQTQLDDYQYKSYMHFNERFQEDAIYRNIECPLD